MSGRGSGPEAFNSLFVRFRFGGLTEEGFEEWTFNSLFVRFCP